MTCYEICEYCKKEIEYGTGNVIGSDGTKICDACFDKAWNEKRVREIRGF